MRLIDADELIKCIPSEEYNSRFAVMNAPTIETQQWIPCSERLPNKTVLCCDNRGEMIIGMPYKDEESNTEFSAESDTEYMIDCVAWMPLPEVYREEE